ncbi:hypothetical protein IT397_00225 [Candidatus Nomurabacteria bacterium]|nr:hypothetical protein [Candidatus Nomurabacteria bacterium]
MKLSVRFFILSIITIVLGFWTGQLIWIKLNEYLHKDESKFVSIFGFVPDDELMRGNREGCGSNVKRILSQSENTADFRDFCQLALRFGFSNEVYEVKGPG